MVDHDDKVLIILDNSNLIILDKETGSNDKLELPYKETPLCMTKYGDKLIVG